VRAVISAGSNIDPEHNLPAALARLRHHASIRVLAVSPAYRTEPVGRAGQPVFLNAAALVETDLEPAGLRRELRGIETALGRVRTEDRNAARTIDLDILLYEGFVGEVEGTRIPDPELAQRAHLVVPAADVAPAWEYGEQGLPLIEYSEPFRKRMQSVMSTEITPLRNARYASEVGMEAVPDEIYDPQMEENVKEMLLQLGEDPDREGLARTPLRVAKAMDFLTSGYTQSLEEIVNNALFESDADEMVLVKDIEFYSLCEHHMLPFFGRAHVAYMPNGRIIGLSKVARIVDLYARRLQVQERLTNQIADAMEEALHPHGVAVVMEASHFCMMMRGVQKQGSSMVTSAMRGGFRTNPSSRAEFMNLIAD
jgi:GTP cyclohydrolase I